MTPQRIVSIWFPHFAIQRWIARNNRGQSVNEAGTPEPFVLKTEGPHGPVLHAANSAALVLGMQPGARITDMRALLPALRVQDAEVAQDAADLAMLERWSRRWCPWSQVDGVPEASAGLLLDTTGSEHLHDGEAAMLEDMARSFARLGLTAHIAVAPTIGAAWALARYGSQDGGARRIICAGGEVEAMLAPLPVAALRLDENTVLLLRRLGLKTIGALADLPREALLRRFRRTARLKTEKLSANPVVRLDQAMGRQRELLVSQAIEPPLRVTRKLAEPLGDAEGMELVLRDLAGDLCAAMEARDGGARALRFTVYRVDGAALSTHARTSRASRDAAHLAELFEGLLETLDPGYGVEAASLEATDHEVLNAAQDDLTRSRKDSMAFARLIDRLVRRLGIGAVLRPMRRGSHVPERSEALVPAEQAGGSKAVQDHHADNAVIRQATTPLRLLQNPEPAEVIHAVPDGPPARFRWRHQFHTITRSAGPERIAPEWWREKSTTRLRDYYHVEDGEGRRYWLYRNGLLGDGRGDSVGEHPRWYVHGMDG